MKKTLVALMALASVACAGQIVTMDQLVAGATLGEGVVKDTYYTSTVYNFSNQGAITNISNSTVIEMLSGTTGYVTIAAWVNQTDGGEDALFSVGGQNDGFKFSLKNDNLQVTTKGVADKNTSMAVTQGTMDAPAWTLVAVTIDLDKTGSDSYFFTGTDGYTTLNMSTGWNLGSWNALSTEALAIGSGNGNSDRDVYAGQIANLTIFFSETAATSDSIMAVMGNTAPIPEPATATLSLLALAGLCARRRRA